MDEVEILKRIRILIIVIICIYVLLNILMLPTFLERGIDAMIQFNLYFILVLAIPLTLLYFTLKIKYGIQIKYVGKLNLNKEYIREIPISYSPAIASYIHNCQIETYTDYTSMILYLCTKKYIKLIKKEEGYIYEVLTKDISGLMPHEKYIYECVTEDIKFDEGKFKEVVIKDAKDISLITDIKQKPKWIIWSVILLLVIIMFSILLNRNVIEVLNMFVGIIGYIVLLLVYSMMPLHQEAKGLFMTDKYYLTDKGKQERQNLIGLKSFMEDYTLIGEKNIEYVEILEGYIPYGLVLGITGEIEKFIINNDTYRSFIYKKN